MESLLAAALSTAAILAPLPKGWKPPPGYSSSEAALSAPVQALFVKKLHEDESVLIVERYSSQDPEGDPEAFCRNLGPQARKSSRKVAGRTYEVYQGLEIESFSRRIPSDDPYVHALGSKPPPPRVSLFERRRFPVGGEAYRFYRCRALDAWKTLGRYRSLQRAGKDLYDFRAKEFDSVQRRVSAACFGQSVLSAMDAGSPVPDIPMPSRYRLRIMAQDEWTYGASRKLERECVHLRPFDGGFYVLRLRAPIDAYPDELPAFDALLKDFDPPASKNP
ncbi:MAG: hypothetical protein WCU88_05615 [Elusimicrobiota bacterium]